MALRADIGEILQSPTRVMVKLWSGSNDSTPSEDGEVGQYRKWSSFINRQETAGLWRH